MSRFISCVKKLFLRLFQKTDLLFALILPSFIFCKDLDSVIERIEIINYIMQVKEPRYYAGYVLSERSTVSGFDIYSYIGNLRVVEKGTIIKFVPVNGLSEGILEAVFKTNIRSFPVLERSSVCCKRSI